MNLKSSILILFAFVFILSCQDRAHRKFLSQEDLENFRRHFRLPKEKTFRLDPNYTRYLFSHDTARYSAAILNHYQPLQATYYDHTGQLVSFHTNCYASTGISDRVDFNWNQKNVFASFIPKSAAAVDSILPLSRHISFIKTFDNKPIDTTGFAGYDYTVVIHCGKKFWPEESKNLIKIVSDNANLAVNKKVNILYVNSDDAFQ